MIPSFCSTSTLVWTVKNGSSTGDLILPIASNTLYPMTTWTKTSEVELSNGTDTYYMNNKTIEKNMTNSPLVIMICDSVVNPFLPSTIYPVLAVSFYQQRVSFHPVNSVYTEVMYTDWVIVYKSPAQIQTGFNIHWIVLLFVIIAIIIGIFIYLSKIRKSNPRVL
jgi:hypothetical protein